MIRKFDNKILINSKLYIEQEILKIFNESFSKTECATKFGFTYFNGKILKIIDEISKELSIDVSHFNPNLSKVASIKYPKIVKDCPICGIAFETRLGHRDEKTTCSISCSNVFFAETKHTELSNLKRSLKLTKVFIGPIFKKPRLNAKSKITDNDFILVKEKTKYECTCEFCGKKWLTVKKNSRFCSPSCVTNNRIKNGTHNGWASRDRLNPSYPEQYVIKLLSELNISYTREYKVGKWFIDFADIDRKLALEIDGKQHELPERKVSDQIKDQYLKDNGWTILRIKWKKISKEFREELIQKINSLFGEV